MIYSDSVFKSVLYGLYVTLFISALSAVAAIILSTLVLKGLSGQNKLIKRISMLLVRIVKGIPLLVLLFIFYYMLPTFISFFRFNALVISIFVLGLNSGINITDNITLLSDLSGVKLGTLISMKCFVLVGLKELGEIIKNTTLLSSLAILELYRVSNKISSEKGNPYMLLYAAAIYLLIYFALSAAYRIIKKKYIINQNGGIEL